MNANYDPIVTLLGETQTALGAAMGSHGVLLESHGGQRFHGFNLSSSSPMAPHRVSTIIPSDSQPAIVQVLSQAGELSQGATLYMTTPPCLDGSRAILAAGVRRVVHPDYDEDGPDYYSCAEGNLLLGLNGVEVELWSPAPYTVN